MELCIVLKFFPQVSNGNLLSFVSWFLFFFLQKGGKNTLHLKITGASISVKKGQYCS